MKSNLFMFISLLFAVLLSGCSSNGTDSSLSLPGQQLPGGGGNNDAGASGNGLTLDTILPNRKQLYSMRGNEDQQIVSFSDTILFNNADPTGDVIYAFPVESFMDQELFFSANMELNENESSVADMIYVVLPKNVNLDYATYALLGYKERQSQALIKDNFIVYNKDMVYTKPVESELTFTGQAMINYSGMANDLTSDMGLTNFDNVIFGNASLKITDDKSYDLNMDFDGFYSININAKPGGDDTIDTTISLSNEDKLSDDLKNIIKVPASEYEINGDNSFTILGKDSPEEVVGDFWLQMNASNENFESNINITGAYGGKVNK